MDLQSPITVPYDTTLRPETTYLPFNNINPGYGAIDPRVADNSTGNQPTQASHPISCRLSSMPCAQLPAA